MAELNDELINLHFEENRKRQGLTIVPQDKTGEEVGPSMIEDKSRKGELDYRILSLVNLINSTECFFTTSSCSGRAILFAVEQSNSRDSSKTKFLKKGCKWLYVTHDEIDKEEFMKAWSTCSGTDLGDVYFKVEPCILHVQCHRLSDAKKLVHISTESGFRNSGMVIGKDNKITVAVRNAMSMEVPLPAERKEMIHHEFLQYLISKGNEKLVENWRRTEKFTTEFSKNFQKL